ncbi:PP2C family protein-serine/threonine phosphatase [Marinospirillum sp.]|uniref:PP2C family protein-serine/threonine phosphatase n=1 Tax=Marinospirillum sp. TaxID=2183934 RepID=UPI00384E59BD
MMYDDLKSLLEFNRERLHSLAVSRQQHLDGWLEQLKREEEVAAQLFYTHLLGKSSDQLPGFTRNLIHQADFSGDLVLAKKAPDGRIFCLLADATGHGLSAALTLMPAASLFRSLVEQGTNLSQLVETINQELNQHLPGDRFIAAILVELDLAERQVQVWNGGLPPLFLLDHQGQFLQQVVSHNLALGILSEQEMEPLIAHLELPLRGQLFAATDGLMEVRNKFGEMFAHNHLQDCLLQAAGKPPFDTLLQELQHFTGLHSSELEDDLSIMHLSLEHLYQGQDFQPASTVKEVL